MELPSALARVKILKLRREKKLSQTSPSHAVFCLARGHKNVWSYIPLVKRNISINSVLGRHNSLRFDSIVFHEGNIAPRHQFLIRLFSLAQVHFVSIEEDFRPFPGQVLTERNPAYRGYALMCRFNYLDLWKHLESYDVAIRVDDDCVVRSLPIEPPVGVELVTGLTMPEGHETTNRTFPEVLGTERQPLYVNEFPYTNVYVTNVSFWFRPDVAAFLSEIGTHPLALENRWGDTVVMGTALRLFSEWSPSAKGVDDSIEYRHSSHNLVVKDGVPTYIRKNLSLDLRRSFDSVVGAGIQRVKKRMLKRCLRSGDSP